MKTANQLDTSRPVELTIYPDFQTKPLIVSGTYEAVQPIAVHVQALEATQPRPSHNLPVPTQKPVKPAEIGPQAVYNEPTTTDRIRQWFQDAHVRQFDRRYGSNLYGELLAQRRRDAVFLKAAEVGLLGRDSDYYKRKLGQLARPSS